MAGRLTGRSWLQAGILGIVIVVAMVAGGFLAVAVAGNDGTPATVATAPNGAATSVTDTNSNGTSGNNSNVSLTAIDDLPSLVQRVMPSVVAISTQLLPARTKFSTSMVFWATRTYSCTEGKSW